MSKNAFWIGGIFSQARKKSLRRMLTGQAGNYTITWSSPYVYASLFYQIRFITLWKSIFSDLHLSKKNFFSFVLSFIIRPLKVVFLSIFQSTKESGIKSLLPYINLTYFENHKHFNFFSSTAKAYKQQLHIRENVNRKAGLMRLISFTGIKLYTEAEKHFMEVVDPTADSRLVVYTLAMPERLFYKAGIKKYIFMEMMEDLIPSSILKSSNFKVQSYDFAHRMQLDLRFTISFKMK